MSIRMWLVVGSVAALLASACGETGGQPSHPGTPTSAATTSSGGGGAQGANTCALVTQSDATTALGEPVGSPIGRSTASTSHCSYTSSSARLSVDIFHLQDSSTAAAKFQEFSNIGGPVSGLGDQARASMDGSLLFILKGSTIVSISLLATTLGGATKQSDVPGATRALGTTLLGRI